MLKTNRLVIIAITTFALAFSACKKELKQDLVALPASSSLSKKVTTDLAQAKVNWNANAGKLVTMTSFTLSGRINTDADKENMIKGIMSDDAMAAYGNILDETTMHLNSIGELQSQSSGTKATMRTYLDEQVNVGDAVVDIAWQTPMKSFTSKCIVHEDAIAWDNLLTSSVMINKTPVTELIKSESAALPDPANAGTQNKTAGVYVAWYKETLSWTGNWIWGSHRGDMGATIKIYCYSNGHVYNTDHSDWANMTLGSTKSYSKTLVNSGSYGKIQYALGIATPFASLSYSSKGFKVSVSGLGSSMIRNGSNSLVPWKI